MLTTIGINVVADLWNYPSVFVLPIHQIGSNILRPGFDLKPMLMLCEDVQLQQSQKHQSTKPFGQIKIRRQRTGLGLEHRELLLLLPFGSSPARRQEDTDRQTDSPVLILNGS